MQRASPQSWALKLLLHTDDCIASRMAEKLLPDHKVPFEVPAVQQPFSCSSSGRRRIFDCEPDAADVAKWRDMFEAGMPQFMAEHPERFSRRVRRGIPQAFRWRVWMLRVGAKPETFADVYAEISERVNTWSHLIQVDTCRTFPELSFFDEAMQRKLYRVLNAYAVHNPTVGYCQGMNFIVGLLLIVSDAHELESFAVLVALMDGPRFGLAGLYRDRLPLLRRYLRVCDALMIDRMPDLHEHFKQENLQPAVYLHPWFLTLFIHCFPLPMVLVLWDVIICEGLPVLLQIAISTLEVQRETLLTIGLEDIVKFFRLMKSGENADPPAARIGQLLLRHAAHVDIPKHLLDILENESVEVEDEECEDCSATQVDDRSWLDIFSDFFGMSDLACSPPELAASAGATSDVDLPKRPPPGDDAAVSPSDFPWASALTQLPTDGAAPDRECRMPA